MKKVLNFGSLLLILNLLIASCGKDPKIEQQIGNLEQGRFALHLGTMGSFEVITRATDDVDVSDFTVHIKGTTLKENLYDSSSMVKGGVSAVCNTTKFSAMISISPVGRLAFLLDRSVTVPVTCMTYSRPNLFALSHKSASVS